MRIKIRHVWYITLLSALLFGCKKDETTPAPAPSETIYVVGLDASGVAYWNNGVKTQVPNSSGGLFSGFVSGTDLYAVGTQFGASMKPIYWKNQTSTLLPITLSNGQASGIFVSEPDIYVAGYQFVNTDYTPVYWKNGTMVPLPFTTHGVTRGIFVSGSDVYVSGQDNGAVYWKNGTEIALPGVSTISIATSIQVVGSDVYVSGTDNGAAVFWKNGTKTVLTPSPSVTGTYSSTIFVDGSDVYVSGTQVIGGHNFASYWKNGAPSIMAVQSYGYSIFVLKGDVYLAGYGLVGSSNFPAYWKNGTLVSLSPDNTSGTAVHIFVKPN